MGAGCWTMGTCVRNCVGRCSQIHSDDEYGTDFSQEQFAVGYVRQQCRSSNTSFCNGVALPGTLEQIRPCQLEMERAQMMTRCKSALSRKARGRAKANIKTRKENARPARPTRALQTSTRARTVAELDIGRKTAGTRWRSVRQFHQ